MDTPFEPKRIKARAIDWDQIHAEFIRARGTHAASSTPNTWPQPTRCQKTKEPFLAGAIHTWFEPNGEGRAEAARFAAHLV